MQTMKGRAAKSRNGWIRVDSLDGLSTRINANSIQQIEIDDNDITIYVEGGKYRHWTAIKRYNRDRIEARLRETQAFFEDLHMGDDNYYKKGAKERHIREDQEIERRYMEFLDENPTGPEWEGVRRKAISRDKSWLKDEDFDRLRRVLESISDRFALSAKGLESKKGI